MSASQRHFTVTEERDEMTGEIKCKRSEALASSSLTKNWNQELLVFNGKRQKNCFCTLKRTKNEKEESIKYTRSVF
jgi:hypothetical protein